MSPAGSLGMSQADSLVSTKSLLSITKLKEDGTNWILYKPTVYDFLCGEGLRRHVEGTIKAPVPPTKVDGEELEESEEEAYEEALEVYMIKQSRARTIINGTIPESLKMALLDKKSATDLWKGLVARFDNQSGLVKSELFTRLNSIKCPASGSDAIKTIDDLRKARADYITAGGTLEDDQYQSIITSAMPDKYSLFINTIVQASLSSGRPVDSEDILQRLVEQVRFDQGRDKKHQEEATAFAAKFKTMGGGGRSRSDIECHNCHKKGHMKADCWS